MVDQEPTDKKRISNSARHLLKSSLMSFCQLPQGADIIPAQPIAVSVSSSLLARACPAVDQAWRLVRCSCSSSRLTFFVQQLVYNAAQTRRLRRVVRPVISETARMATTRSIHVRYDEALDRPSVSSTCTHPTTAFNDMPIPLENLLILASALRGKTAPRFTNDDDIYLCLTSCSPDQLHTS